MHVKAWHVECGQRKTRHGVNFSRICTWLIVHFTRTLYGKWTTVSIYCIAENTFLPSHYFDSKPNVDNSETFNDNLKTNKQITI